jgi:hypothetical protein
MGSGNIAKGEIMTRKTAVSAIVAMMEQMGPDPVSGMGGGAAMGQMDTAGIEVGMAIMPGDGDPVNDVDDGSCGFHPDDYVLAKQLVAQVGSVERARELLENLDEVYETLDLVPAEEEQISIIAGAVPDEPDYPTDRHNMARQVDPGQY